MTATTDTKNYKLNHSMYGIQPRVSRQADTLTVTFPGFE